MLKKTIALMLAAVFMLSFPVSCSDDRQETTANGGTDIRIDENSSSDDQTKLRVYVQKDCFRGALAGTIGYEITDETVRQSADRTLNFAGQEYTLSPELREVTRVFTGDYIFIKDGIPVGEGEDGVPVKDGLVLRAYDIYSSESSSLTVSAGWGENEAYPSYVSLVGENLLYLDDKSEKDLKALAETWLKQIFNFNPDGLSYAMVTALPTERLEGYIEGGSSYLITYTEKVGIFKTRSASLSVSGSGVLMLVHNYPISPYQDKLLSIGRDSLCISIRNTLKNRLGKDYTVSDVKLIEDEGEELFFDVCGSSAYIEYAALVTYRFEGRNRSEKIYGIVTVN